MNKLIYLLLLFVAANPLLAGGLITNTNQSASFTRMQCRDATLGVDAVYFNPAGTVKLGKGIHFSISNQTISHTKLVETNFPPLNSLPMTYEGKIFTPVFPTVYGVLNLGNIAISAGFNQIGGVGSTSFINGIPQIEYTAAIIGKELEGFGVSSYGHEANFSSASVYYGYQFNFAYKVSEKLSVALGARLVTSNNSYKGYLRNVKLNFEGELIPVSSLFTLLSTRATVSASSLQVYVDGGAGIFTLDDLVTANYLTPQEADQLNSGLVALGINPAGFTTADVHNAYNDAATDFSDKSVVYENLVNQTIKAEQSANGLTPVVSVNITPSEKLNIAIKYEGRTKLGFVNQTTSDFITAVDATGIPTASMFPDGYSYNADIPAHLVVGAMLTPTKKLMVTGGINWFFDKAVDYSAGEDIQMIDKNLISYALGVEYAFSDTLRISIGYGKSNSGVNDLYQSDIRNSLSTRTWAIGFGIKINPKIEINVGASYTSYTDGSYDFEKVVTDLPVIKYTEMYDSSAWLVGVGVDLHF